MNLKNVGEGRSMLLVEDDEALRNRLSSALARRGFEVSGAPNVQSVLERGPQDAPELALVDLRLPDGNGLTVVEHLHQLKAHINIVVLTGYGSIATALEAIRRGATWFLTKPADADDVLAAFARGDEGLREALGLAPFEIAADVPPPYQAPSLARMEWEHIQRVLQDCGGNISHAADALGIHRRSLQRKLAKRPNLR
jgi:two-component system response regulator RegA